VPEIELKFRQGLADAIPLFRMVLMNIITFQETPFSFGLIKN
jgi:hypothetical protein